VKSFARERKCASRKTKSFCALITAATVYADERDHCKQYNNFTPVTDTALFSLAMYRGCYKAATNEKSTSTDENFLFRGILNKGNSFTLSEPELAGWVWKGMTHQNP
jgi:hypothetical protein